MASNESPTLPLPPPREAIGLDSFFEAASAAALRSLEAHQRAASRGPNPVPWRIWVGLIVEPSELKAAAAAGEGE
jgi:hypothetical protein